MRLGSRGGQEADSIVTIVFVFVREKVAAARVECEVDRELLQRNELGEFRSANVCIRVVKDLANPLVKKVVHVQRDS